MYCYVFHLIKKTRKLNTNFRKEVNTCLFQMSRNELFGVLFVLEWYVNEVLNVRGAF